jgi:asparagine synthase (glutamine-hydrolysing)
MCGIGGWFGFLPFGDGHADEMLRRLHHRGPDARGVRRWPAATFVHARLSIIDLTPAGEQPLANEDGRYFTVYNGEIYNHHELREPLEKAGHKFRGRSDSEVLPHLFEDRGRAFLTELRGMFAFAIFDRVEQRMLIARDRFGIKPLFYAPTRDGLAFASELRALQCLPGIDLDVDRQALSDYTALSYVPAPRTFFKGIRVLEPGCWLEADIDGGTFHYRTGRYHQFAIHVDPAATLDDVVPEAARRVDAAVRSQLESDVPIGSLLIGGIDSSLVSAAAQKALAPASLRTFNVRFNDAAYDETWAAEAVARHIGSEHRTLDFETGTGSWEAIRAMLLHAGQPFADTSMFAVNAVSRSMRKEVKVALSGDGGDEAFGGYDFHWQIERMAKLRSIPRPLMSAGALALKAASFVNHQYGRWGDRLHHFRRDDASIVETLFTWVRGNEHRALVHAHAGVEPVTRLFEKQWDYTLPNASGLEKLSALTTEVQARLMLPNDFLFKVDIASMRESLEVRVPMLDEELFEIGLTLPHRLKMREDRQGKMVLRELARRVLPRDVAEKKKWGFGVPVDTWVTPDFRQRLREAIRSSTVLPEYYVPGVYRPLVDAFCDLRAVPSVSRVAMAQRVIALWAVDLNLTEVRSAKPLPAVDGVGAAR